MEKIFFNSWESLERTMIIGLLAYFGLILLLRLSGKRTLSKMNAFDLIVTIALGSTLSSTLITKSVALADGLLALGLLIFLQFIISWSSVRSKWVSRMVKSEPSLLFFKGDFMEKTMKKERITKEEVLASIRQAGIADLKTVGAIVFETDGTISAIKEGEGITLDVLSNLKGNDYKD